MGRMKKLKKNWRRMRQKSEMSLVWFAELAAGGGYGR